MADPEEKSSFSGFLDATMQVAKDHWKSAVLVLASAAAGNFASSKGFTPFKR